MSSNFNDNLNALLLIMMWQAIYLPMTTEGAQNSGKLHRPVSIVFDDFKNIGKLGSFVQTIAVVRSRYNDVAIMLQNTSQLEEVYGKEGAATIRGNCATTVYLGGRRDRRRRADAQGPRRGRDGRVARRGRRALDARAAGGVVRTRALGIGRCVDGAGDTAVGGKRPPMSTRGAGTACADLHADVPATGGATKRTDQKARLWDDMVAHMCRMPRRCACGEGESSPPRRKGTKDGNDHRTRSEEERHGRGRHLDRHHALPRHLRMDRHRHAHGAAGRGRGRIRHLPAPLRLRWLGAHALPALKEVALDGPDDAVLETRGTTREAAEAAMAE